MILECAVVMGRGASQSVKWFLCSLCVSATVGSTCVNDTPLCFIVHKDGGFRLTRDKHTDTLRNIQGCIHTNKVTYRQTWSMVSFYSLSKTEKHSVCSLCFWDFVILQHLQQTWLFSVFFFFCILKKRKTWEDLICNTLILCKFGFPCIFIAIK